MLTDLFNAEIVEAYLKDDLSIEDTIRFEKKLREDKDFKEFVSIYQDVDNAIIEEDVMNLRNSLKSVHEVASEEWLDDAPMKVENTHDQDIDSAIAEVDVMQLRSMLNDIHDLNKDELYEEAGSLEEFSIDELDGLMEDDFEDDDMVAALEEDYVMDLRNQLKEIGDTVIKESIIEKIRKPIYRRVSKLTAVASILLLVIIGSAFYIYSESRPMKPENIIGKLYEPEVNRYPHRGGSIDEAKLIQTLNNAYSNFREKEYQHAFDLFQALEEGSPDNMELKVTAGMSLFFLDRMDDAKIYFDAVIRSNNINYKDLAEWFVAGCLLSNREYEKDALKMYHGIALKPDHDYYELSNKVLKKLKKIKK